MGIAGRCATCAIRSSCQFLPLPVNKKQRQRKAAFTDRIDRKWDPPMPLNEHMLHWVDTLLVGQYLRKPLPPSC